VQEATPNARVGGVEFAASASIADLLAGLLLEAFVPKSCFSPM
jgi:hypothetical protein